MTEPFAYLTGNELVGLRKALSLSREGFAKHLSIDPEYLGRAEQHKDEPLPHEEGEFDLLFEKICYMAPRMILVRFDHMRKVHSVLQGLSVKLERIDNDLRRREETSTEEDVPLHLPGGGVDKRSVNTLE